MIRFQCDPRASGPPRRLPCWLPILCAAIVLAAFGVAQPAANARSTATPTEYQVEAAYLYDLGRFTTWPPSAAATDGQFEVCVLGDDPFGPALDERVRGQMIGSQHVTAMRVASSSQAQSCRVLFIGDSEDSDLTNVLADLRDRSVLTVSDMPQFVQRGGMIQFVMQSGKVRFAVNLAAVQRAHLTLSSGLLRVATQVTGVPAPGGAQ